MIPSDVERFLESGGDGKAIAVVGASSNPSKYGNMIVRRLAASGFTVVPVNPRESFIEGIPVRATPGDIQGPVGLVNFVTPPQVTLSVLNGMDRSRFGVVWFQDGSWDSACEAHALANFDTVVRGACIMVAVARYARR